MDWIDDQLVSPIRVAELTRVYDRLVESLISTSAATFNPSVVAIYSSLWLSCLLLERSNDSLSNTQLERVTETKNRCLRILEIAELYTDTPLDLLSPESVDVESAEHGLISWNFEKTISFEKSELDKEESMLREMANTPITDQSSQSVQSQWNQLRDRVMHAWGEDEYYLQLASG